MNNTIIEMIGSLSDSIGAFFCNLFHKGSPCKKQGHCWKEHDMDKEIEHGKVTFYTIYKCKISGCNATMKKRCA
jgi:hypothetical protein